MLYILLLQKNIFFYSQLHPSSLPVNDSEKEKKFLQLVDSESMRHFQAV